MTKLITDHETIHKLHAYAASFVADKNAYTYAKVYAQYLTFRTSDWDFATKYPRKGLTVEKAADIRSHMDGI